jgi:hypothetical protein
MQWLREMIWMDYALNAIEPFCSQKNRSEERLLGFDIAERIAHAIISPG